MQEPSLLSSSDTAETNHDHLKWQGTRYFTSAITQLGSPDEEIKYSGWVEKINNKGAVQPRVMVISNMALYNFKSRLTVQCKRRIDLSAIVHIVRSKYSHQFILCCPQEYDYLYSSVQVSEICDILMAAHKAVTGNVMSVESKGTEDLTEFVLTRHEAKKIRKEHPELALRNDPMEMNSLAPANLLNSAAPATTASTVSPMQEKIDRMTWGSEDQGNSATAKLLPEHHVPSTLSPTLHEDTDPESLLVLKAVEEIYVVKNKKTGEVFAMKVLDSPHHPSLVSKSPVGRCFQVCYRQQLCLSLVLFQIIILTVFSVALRYIVKSCYSSG